MSGSSPSTMSKLGKNKMIIHTTIMNADIIN